ncbi:MAG: hypothetical protein ACREPX_07165, partial [Rhodanobacteraceae bacterium]
MTCGIAAFGASGLRAGAAFEIGGDLRAATGAGADFGGTALEAGFLAALWFTTGRGGDFAATAFFGAAFFACGFIATT